MSNRIKTTHAYGEVYPNVFSDFEWVKEHEEELLTEYGECTILVYEKKIVGKGTKEGEALAEAERSLPPDFEGVITPITYYLARRHPFLRVRPTIVED